MSSRLLAAARVAAARVAANCRTVGSLSPRRFSLDEFFTTLKRDLLHPETRPEHQGLWLYRNTHPEYSVAYRLTNQLLMTFFWYWILFHFYFEEPHPHRPDASKWTDEELGIPPLEDD